MAFWAVMRRGTESSVIFMGKLSVGVARLASSGSAGSGGAPFVELLLQQFLGGQAVLMAGKIARIGLMGRHFHGSGWLINFGPAYMQISSIEPVEQEAALLGGCRVSRERGNHYAAGSFVHADAHEEAFGSAFRHETGVNERGDFW